ncbi:hypothetical protein M778_08485, partial [Neisseria gonorrhoeae MU_NG9]
SYECRFNLSRHQYTSVFRKWMFDGAKVVRRVEGNLWVFGMVALEKTCFKGQMPSENWF